MIFAPLASRAHAPADGLDKRSSKGLLATVLCVAALVWIGAPARAGGNEDPDEIRTLRDEVHRGRVVFETEDRVVLREGSRLREFARSKLASVSSVRESMRLVLVYLRDAKLDDLDVLLELASFAQRNGLPEVARMLWMKALLQEPDDPVANEALGNRRHAGRWELAHEGRWWTLKDLVRRTSDWSDAWEFETLHFRVRTNLGLAQALHFAFDLEHLYYAYYGFLAPVLEVHETTELMTFQLHADLKSFPEAGTQHRSYFSPDQNTAYLNFADGFDRGVGLHEAVHVLVYNTSNLRKGRGSFPSWVDEGLAEYFRAGASGAPGQLEVEPGRVVREHYGRHAHHPRPYSFSRVTNFSSSDFFGTSNSDLKYAQSYTLVDFFLHGDDGAWRERFLGYLAWCYEGRSSTTHLRKKMGVEDEDMEAGWKRYVEYVAGGGDKGRTARTQRSELPK